VELHKLIVRLVLFVAWTIRLAAYIEPYIVRFIVDEFSRLVELMI